MGFEMGYIDEEMLASWGKESEMNEKLADPANKGNFKRSKIIKICRALGQIQRRNKFRRRKRA